MRHSIKEKIVKEEEKVVLNMITCSVCGQRIGCFATHDGYYSHHVKVVPNSRTEYYTILKTQPDMNYGHDDTVLSLDDVHPDCLPKYIEEFVEHEKDHDDYMELNIEHKFEYQSVVTDEEKDDNNDKET